MAVEANALVKGVKGRTGVVISRDEVELAQKIRVYDASAEFDFPTRGIGAQQCRGYLVTTDEDDEEDGDDGTDPDLIEVFEDDDGGQMVGGAPNVFDAIDRFVEDKPDDLDQHIQFEHLLPRVNTLIKILSIADALVSDIMHRVQRIISRLFPDLIERSLMQLSCDGQLRLRPEFSRTRIRDVLKLKVHLFSSSTPTAVFPASLCLLTLDSSHLQVPSTEQGTDFMMTKAFSGDVNGDGASGTLLLLPVLVCSLVVNHVF